MGARIEDICAGCGMDMTFEPDQYVSQLYNPNDEDDFILCWRCADMEDAAVEGAGTNDLPNIVQLYRKRVG